MLFNSFPFLIFFIIVYTLYLTFNHKWQNRLLLLASCIFYGFWDWRFLFLMFFSISIDYLCAIKIHQSNNEKTRKIFLLISIILNLTILGFFKYFNFFINNLEFLLKYFGLSTNIGIFNIILPLGISFYTFEAMSYVIDVYRNKMPPAKNYLDYVLFVTYFPHLIAGPIMRAKDLLPQISLPRKLSLEQFYEGCYLIFWGLFQKMFIADNLAQIVNPVLASNPPYNGIKIIISAYAFAFQIFCDFAGYSNIARGLSKCMGFEIMINFNLPYFATNPKEFWQRWHISLSTWLRDYLYIPLGGNKLSNMITYRNLAITMLLGGLWHGAKWTFIIWGAYHGALLIIYKLLEPWLKKIPTPKNRYLEKLLFAIRIFFFFNLICLGWLFFRAESLSQIGAMLKAIIFDLNLTLGAGLESAINMIEIIWLLLIVGLIQFKKSDLMAIYKTNTCYRTLFYLVCFYLISVFGVNNAKEFIYFQF